MKKFAISFIRRIVRHGRSQNARVAVPPASKTPRIRWCGGRCGVNTGGRTGGKGRGRLPPSTCPHSVEDFDGYSRTSGLPIRFHYPSASCPLIAGAKASPRKSRVHRGRKQVTELSKTIHNTPAQRRWRMTTDHFALAKGRCRRSPATTCEQAESNKPFSPGRNTVMSSKQTDVEKLMLRTRRVARLIWRHTPPLRAAIERDDWLQSAAVQILSITEDVTEELMTRSLRALAMRIIRKRRRQVKTIRMDIREFDKFPSPEPVPVPHRHRIPLIPLLRSRRGARVISRRTLLTLSAFYRLHRSGYKMDTIARKFGLSPRHLYRLVQHYRRTMGYVPSLPKRVE